MKRKPWIRLQKEDNARKGIFLFILFTVNGGSQMVVIDFTKKNKLNESVLRMIGSWTKTILKHMYGKDTKMVGNVSLGDLANLVKEEEEEDQKPNFIIRGKYRDVKAYASAIVREKEYLDAYSEYGKDHPQTAKARENLRPAVAEFESATGIKWPFKDEE